ncbi:ABC transporter substrate-binding protein [Pandoraea bronchicola]|uniref:Iron ABC transporter substrate-binding protein n=1 Tax=Pandoraea bronchicola TaxID=2508287 RepID=A0A5E5BYD2_9BURK|nr:ABC transporter substrate-binding protein [Pandoraea bronchicola]VVE90478.1 iron ABC transporter substrate-binding protein [Pandoraea bronchicola]
MSTTQAFPRKTPSFANECKVGAVRISHRARLAESLKSAVARLRARHLRVAPLVAALMAATLGAALMPSRAHAADRLSLLCSADLEWCQLMRTRFEKETGIGVAMIRKSAGEALALLSAQRARPQFDIWWAGSGDSHLQAAFEGLTEAYRSSALPQLQPWAQRFAQVGRDRTVGVYQGLLGIGYNVAELRRRKIDAPRCWRDLLGPGLKREIQIANPNSSGTAYVALATLVQLMGEEPAFTYMRNLNANVSQYTATGVAPGEAASRGEASVAIEFLHDLVKQRVAGFDIQTATPCEGTGYEIGGMSLVAGALHPAIAKQFYEFALRADVQSLANQAHAYQLPSNKQATVPKLAPQPSGIKLIDYDFARFGDPATRKRLLQRWNTEIYAHAR